MAEIEIGKRRLEAKVSFRFVDFAKDKYAQDMSGELEIYSGLVGREPYYLVAFFDAGLAYVKNNRPTIDQISNALDKNVFNADDETFKRSFAEAVTAMEQSGFLKRDIKKLYDQMDKSLKDTKNKADKAESDGEKKRLTNQYKFMEERINDTKKARADLLKVLIETK